MACICPGNRTKKKASWVVTKYKYNTSAFNGYHPTRSDYSSIKCVTCGRHWRTKAAYVEDLPQWYNQQAPIQ